MSGSASNMPVYTIEVGTPGNFTNDATTDISATVNAELADAPKGDQIDLIFNPGDYAETSTILLPSNTAVIGKDATLGYLYQNGGGHVSPNGGALIANAGSYAENNNYNVENANGTYTYDPFSGTSTTGMYTANAVINTNISVEGMTFNETGNITNGSSFSNRYTNIFGTWFTNVEDVDVQDNTYIGGNDGNAFVNVVNGVVAGNIAIGQLAAFDNWNGPSNITIEDNAVWQNSIGEASPAAAVQINSTPTGDPNNPGNAVNDGIVDNSFTGNSNDQSATNTDSLLSYGNTEEIDITQQGNLDTLLGDLNPQGYYAAGPLQNLVLEDNLIVAAYQTVSSTPGVIQAVGNGLLGTNVSGNLVLGASVASPSVEDILSWGSQSNTYNNAVIDQNTYSTTAISVDSPSAGNVSNSGTTLSGSTTIPLLDISAPATLFTDEDSTIDLSGTLSPTVSDTIWERTASVTLSTQFGVLNDGAQRSGVQYGTISGEDAITLSGSVEQINANLAKLSYTSNANGWDDSIEITANDFFGMTTTRYIPVIVSSDTSDTGEVTTIASGFISPSALDSIIFPGQTVSSVPTLGGDILIASSGNNDITMGTSASIAFLGTGNNTVLGGYNDEYIAGGVGDAAIDLLDGGNITVAGGSGSMSVNAATGDDLIEAGASDSTVTGGNGPDTIVGGLGHLYYQGGSGTTYLATLPQDGGGLDANLGTGNSTVFALSGDADISSDQNTSNIFYLESGNDSVLSGGNDIVYAGVGNDTIDLAATGADSVVSGGGELTLIENGETWSIDGSSGEEYILDNPGGSPARLSGGGSVVFDPNSSPGIVFQNTNGYEVMAPANASVVGSDGSDTIMGNSGLITFNDGLSFGNRIIELGAGGGILNFSRSSDTVIGGAGNVIVNGEAASILDVMLGFGGGTIFSSELGSTDIDTSPNAVDNLDLTSTSSGNASVQSNGNDNITVDGAATVDASLWSNDQVDVVGGNLDMLIGSQNSIGIANAKIDMVSGVATINVSGISNGTVTFGNYFSGTLNFINNSILPQMVSQGSLGSTSVSGGTGGGVYYGGRGGNNSLIGGAGTVTLIGGGSGDLLQANSSHGENELVAGTGRETLSASSDTRNNIFLVDGSSQDMVSTAGSGEQNFLLDDSVGGNCTITGATAAGSINIFDIVGDATSGGANYILKNFVSSNSSIYLTNNDANGAGDATVSSIEVDPTFGIGNTLVVLSDQTEIHLLGVSSVVQGVNSNGIPYLY